MNKIFVIGLSKTATNSVCEALEHLGFNMIHYPGPTLLDDATRVDGMADLPTARYYKELDKRYPGSKFILTMRPTEEWLDSVESHFERRPPDTLSSWGRECRKEMYGGLHFNRERFAQRSRDYHDDVTDYFKNRPQDLMYFNVWSGDGWAKLMSFVGPHGMKIPDEPFPKSNVDPKKQPKVDVVYPFYGHDQTYDLMYSVRAMAQNFTTMGNLWIIGDKPDWMNDEVRHIPFDHVRKLVSHEDSKNRNISEKMATIAITDEVSPDFVYAADDHFILKPWSGDDFRRRVIIREDLNHYPEEFLNPKTRPVDNLTEWQRAIWWTYDHLKAEGYYGWNYETHTPKLVNREQLVQTFMTFGTKYGKLLWQTAHFNMHWKVRKGILSDPSDIKAGFYAPENRATIDWRLDRAHFANWNDDGFTQDLRDAIMERFPDKSRYEK